MDNTNISKQEIVFDGNFLTCRTEFKGCSVETNAFASNDFRKNLELINEILAKGKKDVAQKYKESTDRFRFFPTERGMGFVLESKAKTPPKIKT